MRSYLAHKHRSATCGTFWSGETCRTSTFQPNMHGPWPRFSSGAQGRARCFASFLLSVLTTVVPDFAVCVVTRRFGLALPTPHEIAVPCLRVPSQEPPPELVT